MNKAREAMAQAELRAKSARVSQNIAQFLEAPAAPAVQATPTLALSLKSQVAGLKESLAEITRESAEMLASLQRASKLMEELGRRVSELPERPKPSSSRSKADDLTLSTDSVRAAAAQLERASRKLQEDAARFASLASAAQQTERELASKELLFSFAERPGDWVAYGSPGSPQQTYAQLADLRWTYGDQAKGWGRTARVLTSPTSEFAELVDRERVLALKNSRSSAAPGGQMRVRGQSLAPGNTAQRPIGSSW